MSADSQPMNLRPHPRLILSDERLAELRTEVQNDPFARALLNNLSQQAAKYLEQAPPKYELEGRRLLGVSRRVLAHVLNFALLARLTDEKRYFEAAREEILAAVRFPDWNPSHFLDVAEMAMAIAVGYDWLFDSLSSSERVEIETALLEKALRPSLEKDWFWVSGHNNWNPVCHAGMVFAALAVAEAEPSFVSKVVGRARANIAKVADAYGPDGAYDEGPMYWDYGTSFLLLLCAAMESATGESFDPGIPGLIASAEYMMHVVGPSGMLYNYSDCRLNRSPTAALFWFARKLNRPDLAAFDRARLSLPIEKGEGERLLPFALVWHQPSAKQVVEQRGRFYLGGGRTPVALMRTSWNDPNASFLAIKGGSPSNSHGHMDVGSFVFESDGVRWAIDLPMQDYHSLESAGLNMWDNGQNSDRWKIFRNGPEGHGILRFNDGPQAVNGAATLRTTRVANAIGGVEIDLSPLYPAAVSAVSRSAILNEDGNAVLVDHWLAGESDSNVVWQMLTTAEIQTMPDGFLLTSNGKGLRIKFESNGEVIELKTSAVAGLQRPYDAPNPGVSRLEVHMVTKAKSAGTLAARLEPT